MQSLYTRKWKRFTLFSVCCPGLNGTTGGQHKFHCIMNYLWANSMPRHMKSVGTTPRIHKLGTRLCKGSNSRFDRALPEYPSDRFGLKCQSSSERGGAAPARIQSRFITTLQDFSYSWETALNVGLDIASDNLLGWKGIQEKAEVNSTKSYIINHATSRWILNARYINNP